jgi:hypothetical protein
VSSGREVGVRVPVFLDSSTLPRLGASLGQEARHASPASRNRPMITEVSRGRSHRGAAKERDFFKCQGRSKSGPLTPVEMCATPSAAN